MGYSQATTRAIADAAGVNEVTLFRHFGSKKNLLLSLMQAFNASGFASTFKHELTGDYSADIALMAASQMKSTAANLQILSLLICDARNVPELRQAMLAGGRGNAALISGYFQHQIDLGVVRSDLPAEVLTNAFDNLFSTSIILESLFQGSLTPTLPDDEKLQSMISLFVRGTRA